MSRGHLWVLAPATGMRRSWAGIVSVAWGSALGGTFGCLLPEMLGYWHLYARAPWWIIAQGAGAVLIGVGLAAIVWSFVEFTRARGTPVPVASPPRLVVRGPYGLSGGASKVG